MFFPIETMLDKVQPPQPHSVIDNTIPPLFGRPSEVTRLVFSIDPHQGAEKLPQTKPKHWPLGTPYEFEAPVGPNHLRPSIVQPGEQTPVDDLVNSLAQALFQPLEAKAQNEPTIKPSEPKFFEPQNGVDNVVFVNGSPLITEKKQSLAAEEQPDSMKNNDFSNLFNLFFGPPPKSSLAVAPTSSGKLEAEPVTTTTASTTTTPANLDSLIESKIVKVEPNKEKPTESAKIEVHPSSNDQAEVASLDNMMDLVNTMFSLPQFSDAPGPMQVEAQSSGNRGK